MVSPRVQKKIAIVGQSCRLPGGASSPTKLWQLLLEPRDLHTETPSHWKDIGLSSNDASRSYFLSEDPRRFDRQFFHMHTAEAEATDPQFRLALECVYEALEDAGLPMESLRGSSTAVYAGLSGTDYANLVTRDALQVPRYAATGTHVNMLSNRISYFYNWQGPSMTIDTACSSSLVALDLAVQSLRRDECQMAVVCSSNLLLDSDIYITADNLGLLSPSGRCHAFDSRADGYARGEGIIAIILKTVDLAVSDGNKIRCVVRETGVNHDGYKAGIALPNSAAQQSLIETTYARAGLDCRRARDQCQYIEAHGTGTRAGDPIEAEALSQAFFGDRNDRDSDPAKRSISLGSIKSVVGHLEGCAGLAGILKACLMTQHGVIPPSFDFKQFHDESKPFCASFEIIQNAKPWPILQENVPRRISVNSFGFGGTNAHAIIEEYLPDIPEPKAMPISRGENENVVLPFVFSAASQSSLQAMLGSYSKHLRDNKHISPRDLAWTLSTQRSSLSYRKYFQASKTEELVKSIDQAISKESFAPKRFQGGNNPTIIGIFTGQGAEWNNIQELVAASDMVQSIISDLEGSLSYLPQTHRPSWSLRELLLAGKKDPRRQEAVFAQTINTACQIILVELIRSAGVRMTSLIGHSSGEIAAAYASGFLSRHDAIRIAYYRGFFASQEVEKGVMLAVALPMDQAVELVESKAFGENVEVATVNSTSSVTLSGSIEAIDSISTVLRALKIRVKKLPGSVPYHTRQMRRCAGLYLVALQNLDIQVQFPQDESPNWYSSVEGYEGLASGESLSAQYWVDNMIHRVRFDNALSRAMLEKKSCDIVLEFGPQIALKSPTLELIESVTMKKGLYRGVLDGTSDISSLSDTLGLLWLHAKPQTVDFSRYYKAMSNLSSVSPTSLDNMPAYPWNHDTVFWVESRVSKLGGSRHGVRSGLLGVKSPEITESEMRWTNVIKTLETGGSWYLERSKTSMIPFSIALAIIVESIMDASQNRQVTEIIIDGYEALSLKRYQSDNRTVETLAVLSNLSFRKSKASATIVCHAAAGNDIRPLQLSFRSTVKWHFQPEPRTMILKDFTSQEIQQGSRGWVLKQIEVEKALESVAKSYGLGSRRFAPEKIESVLVRLAPLEQSSISPSPFKISTHSYPSLEKLRFDIYDCDQVHPVIQVQMPSEGSRSHCDPTYSAPTEVIDPVQQQELTIRNEMMNASDEKLASQVLLRALVHFLTETINLEDCDSSVLQGTSFIDLGVDSLIANAIRSWFMEELSYPLKLRDILTGNSIAQLASNVASLMLNEDRSSIADTILTMDGSICHDLTSNMISSGDSVYSSLGQDRNEKRSFQHVMPLSYAQSVYWFSHNYLSDKTALNVSFYLHLSGPLNVSKLQNAMSVVIERHEALRTCFYADNSEEGHPVQAILDRSIVELQHGKIQNKQELNDRFEQLKNHVYDLATGDIFRVILLRESASSHYLLFGYHHLTMDGFSFQQIFFKELEKVYMESALPTLPMQFREHATAQREAVESGALAKDILFWKSKLKDLPLSQPLFPMMRSTVRECLTYYKYETSRLCLDADLTSQIRQVCRKIQALPFHFHLAILSTLLFRFLKIDDLCIGVADSNRVNNGDNTVLGLLLNFLPLRFRYAGNSSFIDVLRQTRDEMYEALEASRVPFQLLLEELKVQRSSKYTPLFQTFVNYRSHHAESHKFADLEARSENVQITKAGYDFSLDIGDNASGETEITFLGQATLLSSQDISMLRNSYETVVREVVSHPDVIVSKCPIYHPTDVNSALEAEIGDFQESIWCDTLIHHVHNIMLRDGSRFAINDGINSWSYEQLGMRYKSIALILEEKGVLKGSRVAVFQEPGCDWVASLLAIMHLGAVYVPLDQKNPLQRLKSMIELGSPKIVLVDDTTTAHGAVLCCTPNQLINISHLETPSSSVVLGEIAATKHQEAVVLFTSGSTGTPKGISVSHGNILCAVESFSRRYNLGPETVSLQHTAYSFDISLDQIFVGLANGGRVHVARRNIRGDPKQLAETIAKEGITYIKTTPSEMSLIARSGLEVLKGNRSWTWAFSGGEQLPDTLYRDLEELGLPQLRLFNAYGPAEASIAANHFEVLSSATEVGPVPIGSPLENYSTYVVDEDLQPVPFGVPGEILIGGGGVSQGYLDQELTKKKFLPDPVASSSFRKNGWNRVFRTGDLGKLNRDGSMVFLGRVDGDTLVKMRGLRIDLGDIEAAVLKASNGAIAEAVVSVRGEPQFLACHVVVSHTFKLGDGTPDIQYFLKKLLTRLALPVYMVPAVILQVEEIPITLHGKRDRRAAALLSLSHPAEFTNTPAISRTKSVTDILTVTAKHEDPVAPEAGLNKIGMRLRDLWMRILPDDLLTSREIDASTGFFETGGNSLLIVQLRQLIMGELDVVVPVPALLECQNFGDMVALVTDTYINASAGEW